MYKEDPARSSPTPSTPPSPSCARSATVTSTPLAPADRLFWELAARYPTRPLVCALYLELAGPPARARLERRLAALAAAHPRLACALVGDRGGPRWRPADPPSLAWTADDALDHDARLARLRPRLGAPLPRDGLAWSLEIVADRPEGDPVARTHGLVVRWHHALTDAEGMLDLLTALTDPDPADQDPARCEPPPGDRKPTIAGARPPGLPGRIAQAARRLRGASRAGRAVGGTRVDYHALDRRLDARGLAALASDHHITPHDLVVGLVARALHRLGLDGPTTTIHAPISARPRDGRLHLGNFGHPLHVVVADAAPDLVASLRALAAANAAAIATAAPTPPWLLRLLPRLPRRLLARALARAPRFVVNYLPWSDAPRWLAGAAITAVHGFAPLLPFRGCTVAAIGYHGQIRLILATDPTIHADAAPILDALAAEVDALAGLASRTPDP